MHEHATARIIEEGASLYKAYKAQKPFKTDSGESIAWYEWARLWPMFAANIQR